MVTVSDTSNGAVTGTSGAVTVNPAAATHFAISAPASVSQGAAFSFTVTALDAYGNVATGYVGTVHFTSSDGRAALPVDYTFQSSDAGVVTFDGIVRNNSRGRQTLYLEYEAYEEMALRQMRELARQARERFQIRHVTIVHRLGRLEIGETSVLIVVAAAHRAAAFDASHWIIDTLKQTVPIWKKEFFADGAVWAPGEPFPSELAVDAAEMKHEA